MWFKQMTCDNCFRPLDHIGRDNKYFFTRILDFKRVSLYEYNGSPHLYRSSDKVRFNYALPNNGDVLCYVTTPFSINNGTWFCSNECAYKVAKSHNLIFYYFDENMQLGAAITPQMEIINKELGFPLPKGLRMQGITGVNWFVKPSDYKDYSQYGCNTDFPILNLNKVKLVEPSIRYESEHNSLILDSDFEKDFYGSNNSDIREHIKRGLDGYIKQTKINFGRRAEICWFILDENNEYVGFIHFTAMNPAFPDNWVLEFGLRKKYRNRGIMSEVLPVVINWAKQEGGDEFYAISEIYNRACHTLINKQIFRKTETKTVMNDVFAGVRNMYVYHFIL